MAVYTPVDDHALSGLLAGFAVGELVRSAPIHTGIENTNYFVTTTAGEFVLTLFETVAETDLPYCLALMGWLAECGVPSAHPVADRRGEVLTRLNGRPAALVQRLQGVSVVRPTARHCAQAGRLLAQLHLAGRGFAMSRPNPRGAVWRHDAANRLLPRLDGQAAHLLESEIRCQQRWDDALLPRGVVHADLFRDNVLFDAEGVSGVVDFYYACTDAFVFDLAVTANDWCCDEEGRWREPQLAALLEGYSRERTVSAAERDAWPMALRSAALRFWLSRLLDSHFPRDGYGDYAKDPGEYQRILERRIADGEKTACHLR